MKPRDSIPTTTSTSHSLTRLVIRSMASLNAGPSLSSVVMSLKRMPCCGKSGTSLIRLARSITAPPGSPAREFYQPGNPPPPAPSPLRWRGGGRQAAPPLHRNGEGAGGWGFPRLQDPGDPESDDGDELVRVPGAVAAAPEIAELVERVVALLAGVLFGHLAQPLPDHVRDLQIGELDHVGPHDRAGLDPGVDPPARGLLLLAVDHGLIVAVGERQRGLRLADRLLDDLGDRPLGLLIRGRGGGA